MVVWFIQVKNERDTEAQRLAYAAEECGCEVVLRKMVPFDDPELDFLPSDKPVLFHGAISCARSVQERKLNLFPFAWFDFDELTCHSYYSHWGKFIAQRNYGLYPLGELPRLKDWLYKVYGSFDEIFVRPDTNDKLFIGSLVEKKKFDEFMNWQYISTDPMAKELVVVAEPNVIKREWRLIVADGRVITGSQYMDLGLDVRPEFPDEAAVLAEEACKVWMPHPVLVVDVGLTCDGYKIVECGSVNCAGYYGCDLHKMVRAMSYIARREFEFKTCGDFVV